MNTHTRSSPSHTQQYSEYLHSLVWRNKRRAALKAAGWRCEKCRSSNDLEVHHLNYARLGDERPQDLRVLCAKCHDETHKTLSAQRQYDAALETYASKKYGENWDCYRDVDQIIEEFDEWLERQER